MPLLSAMFGFARPSWAFSNRAQIFPPPTYSVLDIPKVYVSVPAKGDVGAFPFPSARTDTLVVRVHLGGLGQACRLESREK